MAPEVRGHLGVGHRARRHDLDSPPESESLDRRPFRTVTHQEQGDAVHARRRLDGHVEGMEPSEAPHPADDQVILEPEPSPERPCVLTASEETEIDPGRRDEDSTRFHAETTRFLGHPL